MTKATLPPLNELLDMFWRDSYALRGYLAARGTGARRLGLEVVKGPRGRVRLKQIKAPTDDSGGQEPPTTNAVTQSAVTQSNVTELVRPSLQVAKPRELWTPSEEAQFDAWANETDNYLQLAQELPVRDDVLQRLRARGLNPRQAADAIIADRVRVLNEGLDAPPTEQPLEPSLEAALEASLEMPPSIPAEPAPEPESEPVPNAAPEFALELVLEPLPEAAPVEPLTAATQEPLEAPTQAPAAKTRGRPRKPVQPAETPKPRPKRAKKTPAPAPVEMPEPPAEPERALHPGPLAVALMTRPEGATLAEIQHAIGWAYPPLRFFLKLWSTKAGQFQHLAQRGDRYFLAPPEKPRR